MRADSDVQTLTASSERSGFKLPVPRFALLLTVLMTLSLLWLIADFFPRLDFWNFVGDYPMLSLSHALNIQSWFETGTRQVSYYQEIHPGIPFQLASWLAYRVAQIFYPPDVRTSIQYTLREPDLFWSASQLLALSLGLVGVMALWRLSRRLSVGFALAALLVFFSFRPAWTYGLATLSIDTFALPMAVLFFTLAAWAFRAEKRSLVIWCVLGCLGGVAWLLKLNYIVWSLAAGVGLLVQWMLHGVTLRQFALRAGLFALSFGATGAVLGILFLGPAGIAETIRYHIGVATHTGYYGGGSSSFADWNTILANLRDVAGRIDLWVAAIVLLALTAYAVFQGRRDRAWLKANLPTVACLVAAVLLGYAAAIKHFNDHYLLVAGAVLPLMILWLGQVSARRLGVFLMVVVIALVSIAAYGYFRERSGYLWHMRATRQDSEVINSLPLTDDNVRLWSYRINAGPFVANYLAEMSQVPSYFDDVKEVFPQDLAYNMWSTQVYFDHQWTQPDRVPWQYAIFDLSYFPDFNSLPSYFQENGTEIRKLNTVLVIGRKDGKDTAGQSLPHEQASSSATPLLTLNSSLSNIIGLDPQVQTAPWGIELYQGEHLLWLGHGDQEGLQGSLTASRPVTVQLAFRVEPGPARQDYERTLELTVDYATGKTVERKTIDQLTNLTFTVPLAVGRNTFRLDVLDTVTVPIQSNGETRPLLVLLHHVQIEPAQGDP